MSEEPEIPTPSEELAAFELATDSSACYKVDFLTLPKHIVCFSAFTTGERRVNIYNNSTTPIYEVGFTTDNVDEYTIADFTEKNNDGTTEIVHYTGPNTIQYTISNKFYEVVVTFNCSTGEVKTEATLSTLAKVIVGIVISIVCILFILLIVAIVKPKKKPTIVYV